MVGIIFMIENKENPMFIYLNLKQNNMFSKKSKTVIKKQLKEFFGHSNLTKVKEYLKSKSKNEYGCYYYKENIGGGIEVGYTSNSNCFAEYLIYLRGVGMVGSYGLTKKDITPAGRQRGCSDMYVF